MANLSQFCRNLFSLFLSATVVSCCAESLTTVISNICRSQVKCIRIVRKSEKRLSDKSVHLAIAIPEKNER